MAWLIHQSIRLQNTDSKRAAERKILNKKWAYFENSRAGSWRQRIFKLQTGWWWVKRQAEWQWNVRFGFNWTLHCLITDRSVMTQRTLHCNITERSFADSRCSDVVQDAIDCPVSDHPLMHNERHLASQRSVHLSVAYASKGANPGPIAPRRGIKMRLSGLKRTFRLSWFFIAI